MKKRVWIESQMHSFFFKETPLPPPEEATERGFPRTDMGTWEQGLTWKPWLVLLVLMCPPPRVLDGFSAAAWQSSWKAEHAINLLTGGPLQVQNAYKRQVGGGRHTRSFLVRPGHTAQATLPGSSRSPKGHTLWRDGYTFSRFYTTCSQFQCIPGTWQQEKPTSFLPL